LRLLLDNSISWRVGRDLRKAGHDCAHIGDLGLAAVGDHEVYQRACTEQRFLLTQDSDFGPLHASSTARTGVVLLRLSSGNPAVQAQVLTANLPQLEESLAAAAFVTIEDDLIHILAAP
jgi:predicted nuclease of predicted toxin-antitoxin system